MKKILAVLTIFTILISAKILFKKNNNFEDGSLIEQSLIMSDAVDGECLPLDEFMANYPSATPDEIFDIEECNRERAKRLGLDKRNTSFLGNRNIRPEGALAHYKGGWGSFKFTLYEDHIAAKDIDENHEINLSSIKFVKKFGGALIIEYETEGGTIKRYSVSLNSGDDHLKSEGNTDLDRLITLINDLRIR